jgi:hypothetical protein
MVNLNGGLSSAGGGRKEKKKKMTTGSAFMEQGEGRGGGQRVHEFGHVCPGLFPQVKHRDGHLLGYSSRVPFLNFSFKYHMET